MTICFQFFLVILFHYKTFTHTLFNCKKNPLQNIDDYLFFNFSLPFYSITKYFHKHYSIEKKNPLQNIDDYFSSIFLVILFHYKTFTHILFNCKKIHCKKLMTIFCSIFPCHFIPLQNISTNII